MIKNIYKYRRIILVLTVVFLVILGFIFRYYLNAMSATNGNINILKIEDRDKIYSYTVYSDFYYHIEKYNTEGDVTADFSELIPIQTAIGYDFSSSHPKVMLSDYDSSIPKKLIAKNGNLLTKEIDILRSFSKQFGRLVAMQDEHYLYEASNKVEDIIQKLYATDVQLEKKSIDNFYEKAITLPIDNLHVKPFKLNKISSNIKSLKVCPKNQWCPNIAEWKFGESDRIYLQYMKNFKKNDLDDFYKKMPKNNLIIIKTVKINNNKIQKFIFRKKDDKNQLEAFFMDENGYLYLLKYKANNPASFKKYLPDFLKIAYSVYFSDSKNFKNDFALQQDKIITSFKYHQNLFCSKIKLKEIENYNDLVSSKIKDIFSYSEGYSLDEELQAHGLLKHFNLQKGCIDENTFDLKMDKFYDIYGAYPSKKITNTDYENKKLINEAWDKMGSMFKSSTLKEICNNIECVQKLKDNNWGGGQIDD